MVTSLRPLAFPTTTACRTLVYVTAPTRMRSRIGRASLTTRPFQFFQELLDLAALRGSPDDISMDILAEHQDNRKKYSIATNPNYFAPVFAGVAFTPAAHSFVAALMSNHSSTKPQGELTVANLMSFFSYSYAADGKTLKYKYGYERIPDDWYVAHDLNPSFCYCADPSQVQARAHRPLVDGRHRRCYCPAVRCLPRHVRDRREHRHGELVWYVLSCSPCSLILARDALKRASD